MQHDLRPITMSMVVCILARRVLGIIFWYSSESERSDMDCAAEGI